MLIGERARSDRTCYTIHIQSYAVVHDCIHADTQLCNGGYVNFENDEVWIVLTSNTKKKLAQDNTAWKHQCQR